MPGQTSTGQPLDSLPSDFERNCQFQEDNDIVTDATGNENLQHETAGNNVEQNDATLQNEGDEPMEEDEEETTRVKRDDEILSRDHFGIPPPHRDNLNEVRPANRFLGNRWQQNDHILNMLERTGLAEFANEDFIQRMIVVSQQEEIPLYDLTTGILIEYVVPNFDAFVMFHEDDTEEVEKIREAVYENIKLVDGERPKILFFGEPLGNLAPNQSSFMFYIERVIQKCTLIFQFFSEKFVHEHPVQMMVQDELLMNSLLNKINPHNLIPVTPAKDYKNGQGKRPFGLRTIEGLFCDKLYDEKSRPNEIRKLTRLFNERLRHRHDREEKQLKDLQVALRTIKRMKIEEQQQHQDRLNNIGAERISGAGAPADLKSQDSVATDGQTPATEPAGDDTVRMKRAAPSPLGGTTMRIPERGMVRLDDEVQQMIQRAVQQAGVAAAPTSVTIEAVTLQVHAVEQLNMHTGTGEANYENVNARK